MTYFFVSDEQYAIAASNGINKRNVDQRVREYGMDIEEAITRPLRVTRKSVFSKEELQLLKENEIPVETARMRIFARKWDRQRALTEPVNTRRKYPVKYMEKAERNGISQPLFYYRLKKGLTLEEAATLPVIPVSRRKLKKEQYMLEHRLMG